LPKQEEFISGKQRSEDQLIVLREPFREEDVEVFGLIACVASGNPCQRTAEAIGGEDKNFYPNQETKPQGGRNASCQGYDWNCHNRRSKYHPSNSVQYSNIPQYATGSGVLTVDEFLSWQHSIVAQKGELLRRLFRSAADSAGDQHSPINQSAVCFTLDFGEAVEAAALAGHAARLFHDRIAA